MVRSNRPEKQTGMRWIRLLEYLFCSFCRVTGTTRVAGGRHPGAEVASQAVGGDRSGTPVRAETLARGIGQMVDGHVLAKAQSLEHYWLLTTREPRYDRA